MKIPKTIISPDVVSPRLTSAAGILALILLLEAAFPGLSTAIEAESFNEIGWLSTRLIMIENSGIKALAPPLTPTPAKRHWVVVTAYSSTPDQTDTSPFITAAGTVVRDGIIASNFLPLGTKVMFPEVYPDKIFLVEDRMAPRYGKRADIWFPTRNEAKNFGWEYTEMIII